MNHNARISALEENGAGGGSGNGKQFPILFLNWNGKLIVSVKKLHP